MTPASSDPQIADIDRRFVVGAVRARRGDQRDLTNIRFGLPPRA